MGGRGGASSAAAKGGGNSPKIKTIDGIKGSLFSTWADVNKSSLNHIWAEDVYRPHALLKNDSGSLMISGDKKDKFGLLNNVNTAVIHLRGIDPDNYKNREVNRLNNNLKEIKRIGFDIPKISVSRNETIIYAKRYRFTKEF